MGRPKLEGDRRKRWREKQQRKRLCVECSRKRVNATHCEEHRIKANLRKERCIARQAKQINRLLKSR